MNTEPGLYEKILDVIIEHGSDSSYANPNCINDIVEAIDIYSGEYLTDKVEECYDIAVEMFGR